jgi:hypothetical protein
MKTKIEPIKIVEQLDFSDCIHQNFWLYKEGSKFSTSEVNFLDKLISLVTGLNDSTICVCTEQFNNLEISHLLFEAAKRNNRIYILVNRVHESLKELTSATIIRYGINCIGSFVLVNPNSKNAEGLFFTGGITEEAIENKFAISLDLDKKQVKTLFKSFIYNFWNKSKYEILEDQDWKTNRETKEPPVDVFPSHSDFCDKAFVLKAISESNQLKYVVCNNINEKLVTSFRGIEKETQIITKIRTETSTLIELARNGNRIFGGKEAFPFTLSLGMEKGWLIPNSSIREDCLFYAIPLNENQRNDLLGLCEKWRTCSEYELKREMKRKDLINSKLKYADDLSTEVIILKESNQQLNDNKRKHLVPKESLQSDPYPEKLKDDKRSVLINYTGGNMPFCLPEGVKIDKLYDYWDKEEERVMNYIDDIIVTIERLKKKKESSYDSFKRFFLGKRKGLDRNKGILNEIKCLDFKNLNEGDLKAKNLDLNNLASQLFDDEKEIDYEKEKSEKEEKIKTLESECEALEKALNKFKEIEHEQLEGLKQERKGIEKVFREKYKIEDNLRLEAKKEELSLILNKEKKKYKEEEVELAQRQFDELMEVIKTNPENEQRRYESELKDKENYLVSKKQFIDSCKSEIEKLQEPQVKQKSSLDNLKSNKKKKNEVNRTKKFKSLEIQGLKQLPQIGTLYRKSNQKYLSIEYWEDYEAGNKEATRLDATLCSFIMNTENV